MNIHIETLYYLMQNVNMYVSKKELINNIDDIDERHLNLLFQIRFGDSIKVKRLIEYGYIINNYKDINIRLAVKYGNIDIIYYLIENKIVYFDINNIIGQFSSPETFDILYKDNNLFDRNYGDNKLNKDNFNELKLNIDYILKNTKKIEWEYKNKMYQNQNNNVLLRNHMIKNGY
jgi:hypothetical protein